MWGWLLAAKFRRVWNSWQKEVRHPNEQNKGIHKGVTHQKHGWDTVESPCCNTTWLNPSYQAWGCCGNRRRNCLYLAGYKSVGSTLEGKRDWEFAYDKAVTYKLVSPPPPSFSWNPVLFWKGFATSWIAKSCTQRLFHCHWNELLLHGFCTQRTSLSLWSSWVLILNQMYLTKIKTKESSQSIFVLVESI